MLSFPRFSFACSVMLWTRYVILMNEGKMEFNHFFDWNALFIACGLFVLGFIVGASIRYFL